MGDEADGAEQPLAQPRRRLHDLPWPRIAAAAAVLLLITSGTVLASREIAPATGPDPLADLYPLDVGTTWVYATDFSGADAERFGVPTQSTLRVQITGTSTIYELEGSPRAVLQESFYEDFIGRGPRHDSSYIARIGDQVLDLGDREVTNSQQGEFEESMPPRPVIGVPVTVGHQQTWQEPEDPAEGTHVTTTVKIEPLEVLGTQRGGCVERHTNSTVPEGDSVTEYEIDSWYCPGIGLVRNVERGITYDYELSSELIAFASPGRSAGLPLASTATDTSGVLDPGRANSIADGEVAVDQELWRDFVAAATTQAPTIGGGLVVTVDEDGAATARDQVTGEMRWQLRLRGPIPVAAGVGGGVALVADARKSLFGLDAATGATLWVRQFDDLVATAPLVTGDRAVVTTEDRVVRAISLRDGSDLWATHTLERLTVPAVLAGDAVVIGEPGGAITALALSDGAVKWSASTGATLTAGPAAGNGLVVVADGDGTVYAFDAERGDATWSTYLGGDILLAPSVSESSVVVVQDPRRVRVLAASDGRPVWDRRLPGTRIEVAPLTVGDEVLVLADDATARVLSLDDGSESESVRIAAPDGARADADVAVALGDGMVVATFGLDTPWPLTMQVAFATTTEPPRLAPRLRGEVRRMSPPVTFDGPRGASVFADDDLYVPGTDGIVWRATPAGVVEPIVTSERLVPFVAVTGDTLLTQVGTDLVALPREGGEPLWTFPMGEPYPATGVAVRDGTVAVPVRGFGIAAVDLETGAPRWAHEVLAIYGVSSNPVILDDGDVLHAIEEVARLDADDGSPVWTLPPITTTFGPVVLVDDTLYLVLSSATDTVLAALDVADGSERWRSEPLSAPILMGPGASETVAVVIDLYGVVRAYDATTGEPLWTHQLSSQPEASPVVVGDVVAVVEQGRREDLEDRGYALSLLDAQTGRRVGSFEFGGAVPGIVPTFGASDGRLLTWNNGTIVVLEPVAP